MYIIIKAIDEEVQNNVFVNKVSLHLKSNYVETKNIDKYKIITTALVSKFLSLLIEKM